MKAYVSKLQDSSIEFLCLFWLSVVVLFCWKVKLKYRFRLYYVLR